MTGFLQKLLLLFVLKPEKLIEAFNYASFHFLRRLLRTINRDTGGRPWGQQNFICREITLASQRVKTISAQIKAMLGAIRLHCFPFLMHLPYINIDACF